VIQIPAHSKVSIQHAKTVMTTGKQIWKPIEQHANWKPIFEVGQIMDVMVR
jgi:hypothetical protein